MSRSQRLLGFLAIGLLAIFSACGSEDGGGSDRTRVVATTAVIGALAEEVGQDHIEVTVLAKAGVDPHDFALTASSRRAIEDADVILRNGIGLDDYLEDVLADDSDKVITVTEGITIRHPDEDHGHEEGDPHVWHDPANVKVMVSGIAGALSDADPDNAAAYEANAKAYKLVLDRTDAEIQALIDSIPAEHRLIVTNHDSIGYFIDRYGLEFVGAVIPGTAGTASPSARDVAEIVDLIRETGARAIFSESSIDPKVARQIATDTGIAIVDDLYGDTLGEPGSGAETVDGMLLANAHTIAEALK
jgi:ABC-type Zn uptake system ZnuABC Zn-binding protein ZnuA